MKVLFKTILFSLAFHSTNSNAQFPKIIGNTLEYQKNNSLAYKNLKDKYDFIISYSLCCGWHFGDTTTITILALKNKSWSKILLKSSKLNPSVKPKLEITNFNKRKGKNLIKNLTDIGFWSLRNDSLNIKEIKSKNIAKNFVHNDTIFVVGNWIRRFSILDGSTHYFEIIQNNELRVINCESPDSYLKFLPDVKSTIIFIKAKDAFEQALKN